MERILILNRLLLVFNAWTVPNQPVVPVPLSYLRFQCRYSCQPRCRVQIRFSTPSPSLRPKSPLTPTRLTSSPWLRWSQRTRSQVESERDTHREKEIWIPHPQFACSNSANSKRYSSTVCPMIRTLLLFTSWNSVIGVLLYEDMKQARKLYPWLPVCIFVHLNGKHSCEVYFCVTVSDVKRERGEARSSSSSSSSSSSESDGEDEKYEPDLDLENDFPQGTTTEQHLTTLTLRHFLVLSFSIVENNIIWLLSVQWGGVTQYHRSHGCVFFILWNSTVIQINISRVISGLPARLTRHSYRTKGFFFIKWKWIQKEQ